MSPLTKLLLYVGCISFAVAICCDWYGGRDR